MVSENNPLRQYFRRPAIYLSLPSQGVGYAPGDIEIPEMGEIPVYPMTAIDEISARTPDALFNGVAVMDIIRSCVPAIKKPEAITTVDIDAILAAIKIATNGNTVEVESVCPSCNEEGKYDYDLTVMLANLHPGDYDSLLKFHDLSVKFRPLTFREVNKAGLEQFEVQKTLRNLDQMEENDQRDQMINDTIKRINEKATQLIAQTVESIGTPEGVVSDPQFILEFLENCDRKTYDLIKDYSFKLAEPSKIKNIAVTCVHCQHQYSQPFTINVSDFFA